MSSQLGGLEEGKKELMTMAPDKQVTNGWVTTYLQLQVHMSGVETVPRFLERAARSY